MTRKYAPLGALILNVTMMFLSLPVLAGNCNGLEFTQNKGQWDDRALYRVHINGGDAFLEANAITFGFYEINHQHGSEDTLYDDVVRGHNYRVEFLGSEQSVSHQPYRQYDIKKNFFLGNDKSRWSSNVLSYGEVEYHDLYPGVDMVVYGEQGHMKYDLILVPGSDASEIKLKYEGTDEMKLVNGNLIISTSINEIIEQAPYAYQDIKGERIKVACEYKLDDGVLSFVLPDGYDKKHPLVIDPTLIFSTFSGASSDNWGTTATYDDDGNAYAGGISFGIGFPYTQGAYQTTWNGVTDIAITKYNQNGTAQRYATYIGGTGAEFPQSIIVNSLNHLVIFGTTSSSNYPTTTGAYDTTFNGGSTVSVNGVNFGGNGSDIIVTTLAPNGDRLLGSTFIGGSANDGLNYNNALRFNYGDQLRGEVIVDDQNNIYVASCTRSSNFPMVNGFQQSRNGAQDAVLFKMDQSLTTLVWSSYLGGGAVDASYSIALDKNKHIYVTGGTNSSNFPAAGGYQTTLGGGVDAYIAHIRNDGTQLMHSTYWGTTFYDQAFFVDIDDEDAVYILGQTRATGTAFIKNVLYSDTSGGQFISKFTPELDSLILTTAFGEGAGEVDISPSAFLVDVCNKIYVAGWGGATGSQPGDVLGLTVTPDAWDSIPDATGSDFYLFVIDKNADALIYATFFGSSTKQEHVDGGTSRFDKLGKVYQSICSDCGNGSDTTITSSGAFAQNHQSPNCNNLIFKFDLDFPILIASFVPTPSVGCAPLTVKFDNYTSYVGTASYFWELGTGDTSTQDTLSYTYTQPGIYEVKLAAYDPLACNAHDTAVRTIIVLADTSYSLANDTICDGKSLQIGVPPYQDTSVTYSWTPTTGLSNPNVSNPFATPSTSMTYTLYVNNQNVCIDTITQYIEVIPVPVINLPDTIICLGDSFQVNQASGPYDYLWTPDSSLSNDTIADPIVWPDTSTDYILTVENGICAVYDTMSVTVISAVVNAAFTADNLSGCDSVEVQFTNNSTPPSSGFHWDFGDGDTSNNISPKHTFRGGGLYEVMLVAKNVNTCNLNDTAYLLISVLSDSSYSLADTSICVGDAVPIGIQGDTNLTYNWTPTDSLDDATKPNPIANPTATTVYQLIVSNGSCADTITRRVIVGPAIVFNLRPDTTICIGESVQIGIADNGDTYSWSPVTSLSNPNISNPTSSTSTTITYTLNVDNGFCEKEDTTRIVVNDISLKAGPDRAICDGDTVGIGRPDEGWTYTWTPNHNISSTSDADPMVWPDSSMNYFVEVTDGFCTELDTVYVEVIEEGRDSLPVLKICAGNGVSLGPDTGNYSGAGFIWDPTADLNNPTLKNPIARPLTSTIYNLLITRNGCVDTMDQEVKVGPQLTLDLLDEVIRCKVDSVFIGTADEGFDYVWTPISGLDDPNSARTLAGPEVTTKYYLAADNGWCVEEDSVLVTVPNELLDVNIEPEVIIGCEQTEVKLVNTSVGYIETFWDLGDGDIRTDLIIEEVFEKGEEKEIMLVAAASPVCADTAYWEFEDIEAKFRKGVYNVFTPDGDGQNDCYYFTQDALPADCYELIIWNRWGEKMFESNVSTECWNGNVQGTPREAEDGVYYYLLVIREVHITGFVHLIRN